MWSREPHYPLSMLTLLITWPNSYQVFHGNFLLMTSCTVCCRLGAQDRAESWWGLHLLPGQDGAEPGGGEQEGQGEADHGRGQVRVRPEMISE